MKVAELNWSGLESYLRRDDRAVLPLGCTEQHAFLSLATDSILAERAAAEAAEPLGVPVFPVLPYGVTPLFGAYPGSPTLTLATYLAILGDLLTSLASQGFRRILLVNGHGGNSPAQGMVSEWIGAHAPCQVIFHNWWNAPKTWAEVQRIDPVASHAGWMENFPWTRLPDVESPDEVKPMTDLGALRLMNPARARQALGDGNFGGRYQRSDEDMLRIWRVAVDETRELLSNGWLRV